MKINIFFLILITVFSFGCSKVLGSFSSNVVKINFTNTSGDQVEIVNKSSNMLGLRQIIDQYNNNIGYIQILEKVEKEEDSYVVINTKSLKNNDTFLVFNITLQISNDFLQFKTGDYDRVLVWAQDKCTNLFYNVCLTNEDIKEERNEDFTTFTFPLYEEKNLKCFDLSIQTFDVIK